MTSRFFLFTKQDFYILDWTEVVVLMDGCTSKSPREGLKDSNDEDIHQTKYVKILQSGTQGALYFKTLQTLPTVKEEKNP